MTIKSSTRVLLSFFPPLSRLVISSTLTYLAISFFFFAALIVPIRTDFCAVLCLKFIRHGLRDIRGSQFSVNASKHVTDICTQKYEQKCRKKDEDDESVVLLKGKEAKECVVTSVESLFASYLLTGRDAVCTRHQGILMTCHNNPTIERNSAINKKILPSPRRATSNRIDSTFYVFSRGSKHLSYPSNGRRNWKGRLERNGGSRDFSYVLSSRCAAMFLSYASSYLVDPLPRTRSIGELGKGSREWYSTYTEIIRFPIPCFSFSQIKLLLLCKHAISFSPLVYKTNRLRHETKRNLASILVLCYNTLAFPR